MGDAIWKFRIMGTAMEEIEVPYPAIVRAFGMQDGRFYLWASCNPEAVNKKKILVKVMATGEEVPEEYVIKTFLGTYFIDELKGGEPFLSLDRASLVFHLVELQGQTGHIN